MECNYGDIAETEYLSIDLIRSMCIYVNIHHRY